MTEWSTENNPVFLCKTSALSQKYKIFGMRLLDLYKYMNCTVIKLQALALVTVLTYINYILTKYITSMLLLTS